MQIGRIYTENQISGLYGIVEKTGRKRKLQEKGPRTGIRKDKIAAGRRGR
jgi:hypothetical protein